MVFWNFLNGIPCRIARSISSRMVRSTSMLVALATVKEYACSSCHTEVFAGLHDLRFNIAARDRHQRSRRHPSADSQRSPHKPRQTPRGTDAGVGAHETTRNSGCGLGTRIGL